MNEIQQAAQAIARADALLIGASNGLSIAEGYHSLPATRCSAISSVISCKSTAYAVLSRGVSSNTRRTGKGRISCNVSCSTGSGSTNPHK